MLLRGTLATVALVACAFLSTHLLAPSPSTVGLQPASGSNPLTLVAAPLSLGNPAAAATLTTRPPAKPHDNEIEDTSQRYRLPVRAESGDTLTGMLVKVGVDRHEAVAAIDAMREVFDPRRIRPGHEVSVMFERTPKTKDPGDFLGFSMTPDFDREVKVARTEDGGFTATETERDLTRAPVRSSGTMDSGLFVDGEKAGIPVSVLVELIRIFSWDVDFQRDIWPGDSFEVMWQRAYNQSGETVHDGVILYAKLTLSGVPHAMYRFETAKGDIDYYDEKGQSARKALMRTPVDGARLSSRFGKRKHPILGYTKMHKGVDFAAPIGTPIYAAGDGRIEVAGRNGGYGNYIRIRHNADYSTAYGHMSRFAKVARVGNRVRQGQIIGYVGNTGRSTGPHLHYEILHDHRQVNPLKVKMPSGEKLVGKTLEQFEVARTKLDAEFAKIGEGASDLADASN